MSNFTIDTTKWGQWADRAIAGVVAMASIIYKLAPIIQVHTLPWTPLEEGYLESSFTETVLSGAYPFYEFEFRMSGEMNPKTNYDYAYYQHIKALNHPKRPVGFNIANYLNYGLEWYAYDDVMLTIETDYLSALGL